MGKRLQVREVTSEEREAVRRLAHSRTAPARGGAGAGGVGDVGGGQRGADRRFVFQPKYAAYLNLIEPWWKVLRSLGVARIPIVA